MTKGSHSRFRPTPSTILSLLALLVALGGAGYAANGGPFLLGRSNGATSTTALSASINSHSLSIVNPSTGAKATALRLAVPASRPPLSVTSMMRVPNLNVDRLDNYHANELTRLRQFARDDIGFMFTGSQVMATATIVAPKLGAVFITAQYEASVFDTDTSLRADISVRDVARSVLSPYYSNTLRGPSGYGVQSIAYTFPVVAGTHKFELIASYFRFTGTAQPLNRNPLITAFFMPFASVKEVPAASAASASGHRAGEQRP